MRSADPHIVCLQVGEKLIGLEVDEALDLENIAGSESLTPEDLGGRGGPLASIVEQGGRVIRLLDPARLLMEEESAELEGLPRTASRPPSSGKETA